MCDPEITHDHHTSVPLILMLEVNVSEPSEVSSLPIFALSEFEPHRKFLAISTVDYLIGFCLLYLEDRFLMVAVQISQ